MRFKFPIVSCDLKLFQLDTKDKVQFSTSQILIFLSKRHDHVALSKISKSTNFQRNKLHKTNIWFIAE